MADNYKRVGKGYLLRLASVQFKQNRYVQKCGNKWLASEISISCRDVHWKTLNIKKEVPNVVQTWKNQVGFMMELWHFYQDAKQVQEIPVNFCKVKKTPSVNIIESDKVLLIDKDQGIENYPTATSSKDSIFTQGKNCGFANAVTLARMDYYSGWTSIFKGPWDAFNKEMLPDLTDYTAFNCCQLAVPDFVTFQEGNDFLKKPLYSVRCAPYPHREGIFNPGYMSSDF